MLTGQKSEKVRCAFCGRIITGNVVYAQTPLTGQKLGGMTEFAPHCSKDCVLKCQWQRG